MKITRNENVLYETKNIKVHRVNESVTITTGYGVKIGLSMTVVEELYDILGVMIAEGTK